MINQSTILGLTFFGLLLLPFLGFSQIDPTREIGPNEFVILDKEPVPLNLSELKALIGYPNEALHAGIDGQVLIRIMIDEQGEYLKYLILNDPHPILTNSVLQKIDSIRFTPAYQGGKPVKCWVTIPFHFTLNPDVIKPGRDATIFMTLGEAFACPRPEMVRHINLMYFELDTFPMEILNFKYLVSLDLIGNNISSLPPEIKQLTQLKSLSLRGNRLTSLPRELWQMPNLVMLDIADNCFPKRYQRSMKEPDSFILFPKDDKGKVQW